MLTGLLNSSRNIIFPSEEKLKSYTNPTRNKKYYEKNSDVVKEKAKSYMEKIKETNPEKLKEWRHQAYLNHKAKSKAHQSDNANK